MKLADIDYDEVLHETADAILFRIDKREVWIPKSIAEVDTDAKTFTIPEQFAIKNELV